MANLFERDGPHLEQKSLDHGSTPMKVKSSFILVIGHCVPDGAILLPTGAEELVLQLYVVKSMSIIVYWIWFITSFVDH